MHTPKTGFYPNSKTGKKVNVETLIFGSFGIIFRIKVNALGGGKGIAGLP